MTRLPTPGGDDGTWGDVLNAYLEVSLASDGTLNPNVVGTSQIQDNAVTNAQLDSPTQTAIASIAGKYTKPGGGIPSTDMTSGVQTSLGKADSSIQSSQLGAANGVATLNSSSQLTGSQLPSSVVSSNATSTAKAQVAIASVGSSNAVTWQSKTVFDVRDYGVVGDGTTDDTAAFQAALNASNAANGELYVTPGLTVKLAGTVLLANPTVPEMRISGGGRGSVILDANSNGPCLRYANSTITGGRVTLKGLTFQLGTQKPAYNMVEFVNLATSGFMISDVDFLGDDIVNFYKCNSALYMKNMWEGVFISCKWYRIIGHTIYYDCPDENGGNVKWDSCQFLDNTCGCYIAGNSTTNNLLFDNCKWVSASGGSGAYEFYYPMTSGIPAVGASSITLPAGISNAYFPPNCAVVLFSAAGMEVVHGATSSTYNSSTGALSLRDTVTLNHAAYSDLRVIVCSRWSVISNFLTPSMLFSCCHFEQTPVFLKDSPGSRFDDCEISISQTAYTNQARGVYIAGTQAEGYTFKNNMLQHPNASTDTGYAMVYGLSPSPLGGTPSVEIDGVNTYAIGQAGMAQALYTPLAGDATYMFYAVYRVVSSLTRGVERMSVPGYNSWNTNRTVTFSGGTYNTPYTLVPSDDIILVDASLGAVTINLARIVHKTVSIKKVDSTANAVTIVAGGPALIDGAASISLTSQYQSVAMNYDGTNFWELP